MDVKFWKVVAGLGVPGLALGIFYKLYDRFDWPVAKIPPDKMVIVVIVFLVIVAAVVMYALFLWHPPRPAIGGSGIAVSVPKNWKFKHTAEQIAGQHVVEFIGFTNAALAAPMQPKEFVVPTEIDALRQICALAGGKVPAYEVELTASGKYILRVT